MFQLNNKTVLITGSSGGIGLEIAKLFHQQGANVIITGSNEEKLSLAFSNFPNRAYKKLCNLADSNQIETFFTDCEQFTGQIDILVCNAGITKDNLIIRMKQQDFLDVINVNLNANFALNKIAIKKMLKLKWGRVINISSIIGFTGNAGQANYAASKAGLIGLTKSLAQEVASKNITVNAIAPGFIKTPMTDKLNEEQQQAILGKIPSRTFGEVADVAASALFLASNEAKYITGQTIHVNGGMYM